MCRTGVMATSPRRTASVFLALLTAAVSCLAQNQNRDFDPCQTGQRATVGKPYVVGFAYLAGEDASAWESGTNSATGLPTIRNPCAASDRAALGSGLKVGVFSLKTESLQLLRTDTGGALLRDTLATPSGVLTLVAYNGDFVTQPRVITSNNSALTDNTGIVTSLNLVLAFQRGTSVVGSWDTRGCGTCADDLSSALELASPNDNFVPELTCIDGVSCAVQLRSCSFCSTRTNAAALRACLSICSTTVNVGWAGTDSNSQSLISSYILTQATDFSISGLFANNAVLETVVDGITGLLGQ